MRNHRHSPAHALARLHDLRAGRRVDHEDDAVGAGLFEACELRHHVDVVVLEFLDADDLDGGIGLGGGLQAFFVALAPGIVDQHEAGFLGAEF